MEPPALPTPAPLSPAPQTPAPPAAPVLSEEHYRQLAEAGQRAKVIRRAVGVSSFNAWCAAIAALVTIIGSIGSVAGMALGFGIGIVAAVEFYGRDGLRKLEPKAARMLAMNQIAFAVILLAYAGWGMYSSKYGPGIAAEIKAEDPSVGEMLGGLEDVTRSITMMLYGTVAAVAVLVQGGTALYYLSRERLIKRHLRDTPPWALRFEHGRG
jgi:hypothetical protein